MRAKDHKHISLKAIVGLPVLLLIFGLTLSFIVDDNKGIDESSFNPFLNNLPSIYQQELNSVNKTDKLFYSAVVEDYGRRELVVFALKPDKQTTKTRFKITIYPKKDDQLNLSEDSFHLTTSTDAILYNDLGQTYGIYTQPLPFVDIDKIQIEQEVLRKRKKWYKDSIFNPFSKPVNHNLKINKNPKDHHLFKANAYLSLFHEMLKDSDISYQQTEYIVKNSQLFSAFNIKNEPTAAEDLTFAEIENINRFWKAIKSKDSKGNNFVKTYGKYDRIVSDLFQKLANDELNISNVFDLEKLSKYYAIKNLFSASCSDKEYFIYNTSNGLLEPHFIKSKCIGEIRRNVLNLEISNINFSLNYIQELHNISQLNILESIIKRVEIFEDELALFNEYDINNIFNLDVLKINQRIISKVLNVERQLEAEVISFNENNAQIIIRNSSIFPLHIHALNYGSNKEIVNLDAETVVNGKTQDTLTINLPRSFENLFVSKQSKQTGFILNKHIYDLNLSYSLSGLNDIHLSSIRPFEEREEEIDDLLRNRSTISDRTDITVNKAKKIITFKRKSIEINSPLILPKGYKFIISPNTQINIIEGGKIISHSPVEFRGKPDKPIRFYSSDKKGQGIIVFANGASSELRHVIFEDLTNPSHKNWSVTGAVSFYESPVNLKNVTIQRNRCEDALNIIRSSFKMLNCKIIDTQSDAFDGDFVTGEIISSTFENLGNDAIDVSGSNIKILDVYVKNAGDKGLSAGEDSKMHIERVEIHDSEIGVAGKDLSIVTVDDVLIKGTKLGFTAFKKKSEFGPSKITAYNLKLENVETNYLVERSSSLFVDGKKIETSQNVLDRMYGAEFGRSSEETRNNP